MKQQPFSMQEIFQQIESGFAEILQEKRLLKGTLLHRHYEICNNLYLVRSGVLRSYYYVEERDVTAHFAMEYGVVAAADSLFRGKPSRYNIEVLEDSQVLVVDYSLLETFLAQKPHLEKLTRQFTQLIYMDLVERLEGMTFLSAKVRYDHLLSRYPGILQRVSLGHIASFLGITQETLSRVRGLD